MSQSALTESTLQWETDEHFKILTHPSQLLVWMADATARMDFVSPSWARYTGRNASDELGHGWLAHVPPADAARLRQTFIAAAADGQSFRVKFRLTRHDGYVCWMAMEGMTRRIADHSGIGFIGFCLDITPMEMDLFDINLADQRMVDLLRHTKLAAVTLDTEGRILYLNEPLCSVLGKPEADLVYRKLFDHCEPAEAVRLTAELYPQGQQAEHFPVEFESTMAGRNLIWHSVLLHDSRGQVKGSILIGDDITERRAAEEKLKLTHRVFDATDQAMVITDAKATIISVNQAFARLTGYSIHEAIGNNPRLLQSGRHSAEFYRQMWKIIAEKGHWHGDIWDRRKDGSLYPKFLSISAIHDSHGNVTHYCGIFYDISERKAIEEKLDKLAHYDSLTGLPNRAYFNDHLEHAVSQALRGGTRVALLYIDLDHFKEVNDAEGHQGGDTVLIEVAARLTGCVRSHDMVARLGGDEFAIMLTDVHDMESIARVTSKLLSAFASGILVSGKEYTVTPSIGVSIYPDDHHSLDVLLNQADQAMYVAKRGGRNAVRYFHDLPPAD